MGERRLLYSHQNYNPPAKPPLGNTPKTTTETLPLPTLNILPSTPQVSEHHDRTATPSPTNESAKAQTHHLCVIPIREIPIVIHDPLPRKGIMKQAGIKRGRVSEGRGVQFSESASEIEVGEEDEEDEKDEVAIGGGEKLKKKSGGFASWFRRGGIAVLGPGTGVAIGVAVVSPPPSSSPSSGELLSHVSEGTVGKLTIHHRVMHHHRDMHQPPREPCRSILGGIADCKMNGTIASKIYMPRKDIEIH
ncbi:hypothetical protein BGX38DRAFT_384440 [Terfezia claveryi]|nr:hypothetical protein BGX38DRAFT_384440 [Terfezia claveryi]